MTKLPTGRGLFIAEKSSFKKTMEKLYHKYATELPYTLDFECFAGHVVELPKPAEFNPNWAEWKLENLPMIPAKWTYKRSAMPGKDRRYDAVMAALNTGKYDFIINGGDPEREGQLIQDAFFSTMNSNLKTLPIYRFWNNDEKDETLLKGLKNLLSPDDKIPGGGTVRHLSEASFLRARLDWLLGLNSTQALSLKTHAKVPIGRVKTPILKIIVDRELEIRNFKVEPFWTIRAIFNHENGDYLGTLLNEDGKVYQFFDKAEADSIASKLDPTQSAIITDKKVNVTRENAPQFFSMSKLQGAAAKIYGISMPESLNALQWLYEQKILSYPRTDSRHITEAMTVDIPELFKSAQQAPQLVKFKQPTPEQIAAFAKNKSFVNDKEVRGHTALMPTTNLLLDFNKMTETQQNVFYLVARSVVLPFLGPIVKEKTEIITELSGFKFKTNGSVIKEAGWMVATPEYNSKDQVLPAMEIGDPANVVSPELKEGKTTPPKRYTPDSMMNVLENIHTLLESDESKLAMKKAEGLGRPSTRTAILEALASGQMITVSGKKQEYGATDFGIDLIMALKNNIITSPQLTATWETRLQDLEDGNTTFDVLYRQIVDYTNQAIDSLKKQDFTLEHAPVDKSHEPIGKLPNGNDVLEAKSGFYDTDFIKWREACDAAKAAGNPEPAFNGFWTPKKWDNESLKMTGSFTRKDMKSLLTTGKIEKEFTWKKNNTKSKATLVIGESGRVEFVKRASTQKVDEFTLGQYGFQHIVGKREDGTDYNIIKCLDPEFIFSGVIGGYELTRDDLAHLVNGETIERTLLSKAGKEFQGNLTIVFGQGLSMEPVRSSSGERVSPHVTRHERDARVYYQFDNGVYCNAQVAQHTMTIDELETLATGGSVYAEDFVSKSDKTFSAKLVVSGKDIKFDFS